MKTCKAVSTSALSVILAVLLLFGSCTTAFAAEQDIVPTGLCIDDAAEGIETVVTFSGGGDYTADGTVSLEATEKNPIIERIASIETRYEGETLITIEPRDIAATGSSTEMLNGYYAVDFNFPDTEQEAFLTGLSPQKADIIQQKLIDAYIGEIDFSVEDTGFIDAEKITGEHKDSLLCWAGTTSNMLQYSGWGKQAGFETEDDLFDLYEENFNDTGGWMQIGIEWFFSGTKGSVFSAASSRPINYPNSGRYLPDYDPNSLFRLYDLSDDYVDGMKQLSADLRAGYAAGLVITFSPSHAHAITCWGYVLDDRYSENEAAHYAALFVSDSDDSIDPAAEDRRVAPNTLSLSHIVEEYDDEGYYYGTPKTVYRFRGAALTNVSVLAPYSDAVPKETDPDATKDRRNSVDLYPISGRVACSDKEMNEASDKVGSGEVYVYADVLNFSDYQDRCDTDMRVAVYRDDELVVQNQVSGSYHWHSYLQRTMLLSVGELEAGDYTAEIEINPDHTVPEAFYSNNALRFDFTVVDPEYDLSDAVLKVEREDRYDDTEEKCVLSYEGFPDELMKNAEYVSIVAVQYNGDVIVEESGIFDDDYNEDYPLFPSIIRFLKKAETAQLRLTMYRNGVRYIVTSERFRLKGVMVAAEMTEDSTFNPSPLPNGATALNDGEQLIFRLTDISLNYGQEVTGSYMLGYYDYNGEMFTVSDETEFSLATGGTLITEPIDSWSRPLDHTTELFLFIRLRTPDGDLTQYSYAARLLVVENKSTVVTSAEERVDPYDNQITLSEAVANAADTGQPVSFAADIRSIGITSPIEIEGMVTIVSDIEAPVSITSTEHTGIFTIKQGGSLSLSGLLLRQERITPLHGAFVCEGGSLYISDCCIMNPNTSGTGGMLYLDGGNARIKNSYICAADAADGSVAYIIGGGTLEMLNCLADRPNSKGSIFVNKDGKLNLINCTVDGAVLHDESKSTVASSSQTNIINSIVISSKAASEASGSVKLYSTAYGKLDNQIVRDDLSRGYEIGDLFKLSWLGNPVIDYYAGDVHAKPIMLEPALEGSFLSVIDGEVCLSRDYKNFTSTGVTTDFTTDELKYDMYGNPRMTIYGCCSEIYAPKLLLGDVNLDGEVDITDATMIQRYDAIMIYLSDEAKQPADVDQDGEVTIIDATWLQRYLAGMHSPLDRQKPDNDELYANAVRDAMNIGKDEIMPLVSLTKDDENVIWNDDKALVLFMHKYPDSYPAGEDIQLKWGDVRRVSAGEIYQWVKDNGDGVEDWTERLHQVLGMPTSKGYDTITALWVDSDLLYRPAYVTDPTAEMKATYTPTGDEAFDTMYKAWFESNVQWSYYDSAYPWTRLGYTYDWADNGTDYRLSEFIIFNGANARVEYTYSVQDFVEFAKAQ